MVGCLAQYRVLGVAVYGMFLAARHVACIQSARVNKTCPATIILALKPSFSQRSGYVECRSQAKIGVLGPALSGGIQPG